MPGDPDATDPHLVGSRDPQTGQVYFPPRALAADGSLRVCEPVRLVGRGVLTTWTKFAGRCFGHVDLQGEVRIQCEILGDLHEIGATYELDTTPGEDNAAAVRFRRV